MKVLRIFTVLLLLFFLFNYFTRKNLPFAYADIADYNLLYTTTDNIYVKKLEIINDSIDILFGGAVKEENEFKIYSHFPNKEYDPDTSELTYTGKTLRYKPPPSQGQIITVTVNRNAPFSMNVSYTPKEVYRNAGNSSSLSFEVTSADIAIEPPVVREVSDWAPGVWAHDGRISMPEVDQYLLDSAGIYDYETTVQKVLKIGRHVLSRVPDNGFPADSVSALDPLRQLELARAGKTKLWCGNYTAIFGCLAEAAGISYRIINTGGIKNNLGLGNHSFCEVFLKEEKRWAYVDLTNKTILLQLGDRYLNTIDLQRLLLYPIASEQIRCYTAAGDSISIVPFHTMWQNARYYFHQNTYFIFFYKDYFLHYANAGFLQRAKNLFFTRPIQAVYSDNLPANNYPFRIRIISNYLLIAAAAVWLIVLLRWLAMKFKGK